MWQAEVLQRQGWWVTKHPTKVEADKKVTDHIINNAETTNPITKHRIIDLDEREALPPPNPPSTPFDESWS